MIDSVGLSKPRGINMIEASEFRPKRPSISRPLYSWEDQRRGSHASSSSSSRRGSMSAPLTIHSDRHPKSWTPHHLEAWKCAPELWNLLPEEMIEPVKLLQHAGATVNTILERIAKLHEELGGKLVESDDEDIDSEFVGSPASGLAISVGPGTSAAHEYEIEKITSKLASLGTILSPQPSLSSLSSFPESPSSTCSMGLTRMRSLSAPSPPAISKEDGRLGLSIPRSNVRFTGSPESASPTSTAAPTTSPLGIEKNGSCFPPPSATPPIPWRSSYPALPRIRSYNRPPSNPRLSQWRHEVSYLHGNAMINLKHWLRRVDSQWKYCCSQPSPTSVNNENSEQAQRLLRSVDDVPMQWEGWLLKARKMVADLEQQSKDVAPFEVEVVGWS